MNANITIKLAGVVLAFALSAGFTAPAHAIASFSADVSASLRVTGIQDANGDSVVPFGDPLDFSTDYLSLQGDFEANQLSPPLLQQQVTGTGTASATGVSQVLAGGVEQTVDVAGDPLGDGASPSTASPLFFPLGAAFGIDPALPLNDGINQQATVSGDATSGLALASVFPQSFVFIDNNIFDPDADLTVSFALDFAFNGSASFDPLAGESASSRIEIRVLDNFATDLITPISADTATLNPFGDSGSIAFDVSVPSPFNDPFLSFQQISFLVAASGRAEAAPVAEPAILSLFGIGLLGMAGLGRRRAHLAQLGVGLSKDFREVIGAI